MFETIVWSIYIEDSSGERFIGRAMTPPPEGAKVTVSGVTYRVARCRWDFSHRRAILHVGPA